MIVLFAFLHHLAAFTLVAAVALEFVLLRGELTLWSARRLQVADMILGLAAGVLLIVGLVRVVWLEKGAAYLLRQPRLPDQAHAVHRGRLALDRADHRVPVLARRREGRAGAGGRGGEAQARADDRAYRARCDRADPALRGHYGQRQLGLTSLQAEIRPL